MKLAEPPMSEDELYQGVTDALTLAGWRWMHIGRSDGGVTRGFAGFPDIIACHPTRPVVLVLELKGERGVLDPEQGEWLRHMKARPIDARLVRPADYDSLLREIVGVTKVVGY